MNREEDTVELLSIEQVAERLSLGRTVTYALIMSGEIESVKVKSRRLIPSPAIDHYIERLRAETREAVGA